MLEEEQDVTPRHLLDRPPTAVVRASDGGVALNEARTEGARPDARDHGGLKVWAGRDG